MKRVFLLIYVLSAFTSFSQTFSDKKNIDVDSILDVMNKNEKEAVGKKFPDFKINLDTTEYSNSTLIGKTVFINFWFAACPPCVAEFNELNKLYEKFKDKSNFEFLSFTFENFGKIESLKKIYGINYRVISIKRDECYNLNFHNGFPTSIILDKDGKIKLLHTGGSLVSSDIQRYFKKKYYPLISKEL